MKSFSNEKEKQKNKKAILNKIRSNYILKKIYINLNKKTSLELIKYNKKLQQRLNIELNDYKNYCETYSTIEIEIIPALNHYGKFININSNKGVSYIHIYFLMRIKMKEEEKNKKEVIYI